MLDLMRLFVQIIEEQSYSAVARRLGISQPAVSNQMRVLELKVGSKLLYRKGKGIALTAKGEIVFQYAELMLGNYSKMFDELGGLEDGFRGKVHIGASHIPGEYLLPARFAALQLEFPAIRFKLSIDDSLEITYKLIANNLDFAVAGAVYDPEKIRSDFWINDELMLVVAKNHPLAVNKEIHLEDLCYYPMVISEPDSGHRRILDEALTKAGLQTGDFPIGLETGSTEAVKNAIRSGLGYTFISKHALQTYDKEQLYICRVEELNLVRNFYLLSLRNKPLSPAANIIYRSLTENTMKDFRPGEENFAVICQ
ncbi:MAG: LysR family transcriptional regulator [Desulfitobacteriaceae bacterium]|nr:LysR family transcriptional regulator [Desulfitobacteriaceae bacterium]MDD4345775.1 LysR family transcriptional regulator [Desulfitobacteriaceae bacterium]